MIPPDILNPLVPSNTDQLHKFAFIVGAENSEKDPGLRSKLRCPQSDVYAMAATLQKSACGFKLVEGSPFFGQAANTSAIMTSILEKFIRDRTAQDFLLFYFSGHAQPVNISKNGKNYTEVYLVTSDFHEENARQNPPMYISFSWLRELLLEKTEAGIVLLILDCCYGANIFYNIEESLNKPPAGNLDHRIRGILAATGHNATTAESDKAKHGLMTDLILKALKGEDPTAQDDGHITIPTLIQYLTNNGLDHSEFGVQNSGSEWILAKHPKPSDSHGQSTQTTNISQTITHLFEELAILLATYPNFDHTACNTTQFSDLDAKEIEMFLKKRRTIKHPRFSRDLSAKKQLEKFGYLKNGSPTYGALLCFGKEPQKILAGAYIHCFFWKDNDHYHYLDDKICEGCLLKQFKSALIFLRKHLHQSQIGGKIQWDIPLEALEEALANALIHREYATRQTEYIEIHVYENKVEIRSPGGLPPGRTRHMFQTEHVSYQRNPQIANIFDLYEYGTHLAGRGKKHMEEEMQNAGLQPPKYDINRNRAFQVTFFRPSNRLPKKIDQSKEFKTLIAEGIESLSQKKSLLTTLLDRNTAMPDYHFSIEDLQRGFIPTDPILIAALALAFARHGKKNQEWTQKFLEAAKHPNPPDLITKLYPRKFLAKVKQFQNKKLFRILAAALLVIFILPLSIFIAVHRNAPGLTEKNREKPLAIGFVKAPDGELIGLSDGTYTFDTNRIDEDLKLQASTALRNGKNSTAQHLWIQAIAEDTNDAEALIYQEDQLVLASHAPYVTFVIGTTLTGGASAIGTGHDDLQGAFVAQKEHNDSSTQPGGMQVRLLIANAGGEAAYAVTVAKLIVQAAIQDPSIIGVIGWPDSSYALQAMVELSKAHIPMISPTASSDPLSTFPFFFQIAPPACREGSIGARYAEQQLHARRVALFFDPEDPDSFSLARAFQKQFIADGDQIVVTEKYTTGKPETLPKQLRDAISDAPDLLYFAGHSDDMSVILTDLPDLPSHSSDLQIMGGNALFQLQGYSSSSHISFSRLHFTAFAYSDAWDSLKLAKQKPVFFTLYPRYFDPNQLHISPQTSYGYDLPDSEAILSYDALSVLLYGSKNALQTNNSVLTSDTLQQSLKKITGSQAFQGVSGQISFDSENKPINKTVIVLSLAQNGQIVLDNHFGIQGCFFLPGSCTNV